MNPVEIIIVRNVLISPVSEFISTTRITDAGVVVSFSESSASSKVENLVFPTECWSELLVATTFVSQPALRII